MVRPSTILALVILSLSVFGVFEVKYRVQDLRKDLQEVNRQLQQEKEAIHVLKAEWAYLNKPERLKRLAETHLGMQAITVLQMRDSNDATQLALSTPNTAFKCETRIDKPELPIMEDNEDGMQGRTEKKIDSPPFIAASYSVSVAKGKVDTKVKKGEAVTESRKANPSRLPAIIQAQPVGTLGTIKVASPKKIIKNPVRNVAMKKIVPTMQPVLSSFRGR